MLTPTLSRQRQTRLLDVMQSRGYDAMVVGSPPHVYYLSAHLTWWQHHAGFVLFADGRSLLIAANAPNSHAAADDARSYPAQLMATLRNDQPAVVGAMLIDALRERRVGRIGLDASAVTAQVAITFDGARENAEAELSQMRRVKDADELELMTRAIAASGAMYARAREIIEPGVPELTVFAQLHEAAVTAAGEPLGALLGNDYACGVPGGPARGGRVAKGGELYILDLGPVVRGYFSDSARTIAVNRNPTDAQARAHEDVLGCLAVVESTAKAGVRCRAVWDAVNEHLNHRGRPPMTHHLGHGVGLSPHEFPHLNPEWDDTLREGEIFTAEPGIYGPELAGGIRIENMYRVTSGAVVRLTDFPVELW
jgi:Xaa-Pro dipeptidase